MFNNYYDNNTEGEFEPYENENFIGDNMIAPYSLGRNLPINFYSPNSNNYAQGGSVRKAAQRLQNMGRGGDTMLAHINPLEAVLLKQFGGSGTINPKTGLREYGFFKNPFKAIKKTIHNITHGKLDRVLGEGIKNVGTVLGSVYGGPMGGAIAGGLSRAAGSAIQGKKNLVNEALMGGLTGLGSGMLLGNPAGNIAFNGGKDIFGVTTNAFKNIPSNLMGNLGNLGDSLFGKGASAISANTALSGLGGGSSNQPMTLGVSSGEENEEISKVLDNYYKKKYAANAVSDSDKGFFDKLLDNTKNFATDPKNLLTIASVAGQFMNRPKEKSPEELAALEKRRERALRYTPAELAEKEAYDLGLQQAARRISKEKYLPEERILNISPRYVKTNSPEEYRRSGRWLEYYDNPEFTGNPVAFAEGGGVNFEDIFKNAVMSHPYLQEEIIEINPLKKGMYFDGFDKGKADTIKANLSDGEYVIPSDIVSFFGDGNNRAGAIEFDRLIENARRHQKKGSLKHPVLAKPLTSYLKNFKIN